MLIEILPLSIMDESSPSVARRRLRNPVVRYNTGDIGSLYALPESARAIIAQDDRDHL